MCPRSVTDYVQSVTGVKLFFTGLPNYNRGLVPGPRTLPSAQGEPGEPKHSLRFYALHMREPGFIKATRHKIVAEGTNWRLVDELKRELKP